MSSNPSVRLVELYWKLNLYKYEKVRRSGRYNMIMEAEQVIKACGITSQGFMAQNSQWHLTVSVDTGTKRRIRGLVDFKLWEEYHDWALENWGGEDLEYCLWMHWLFNFYFSIFSLI